MKKLSLSLFIILALAFTMSAATGMIVKKKDGSTSRYNIQTVKRVYYEEIPDSIFQGVSVTGVMGGYTYVDLGLPSGTMWATYNVGATKPTEAGNYFSWGETDPTPEVETWSNYKWCYFSEYRKNNGCFGYIMTKYSVGCSQSYYDPCYDEPDDITRLEGSDDAAVVNWGKGWRTPTEREQKELTDYCDWTWIENFNGSNMAGNLGVSKRNGKTIFLPALRDPYQTYEEEHDGYYWSSSLDGSRCFDTDAKCIRVKEGYVGHFCYLGRYSKCNIRAIFKPEDE